ncbi:MAG: hydroxymethylbilane synthase [Rhodobacteraceae bacterium]|nr:hydroxymethylbilane synthase [Paracoccaceae bacterium]
MIRVGTRASPLARAQADEVIGVLAGTSGRAPEEFVTVPISTRGDRVTDQSIRALGGKGVFCTEIETALLLEDIDLAVHSFKDMPWQQPEGLVIDCVLPRVDVRDALVCTSIADIDDLPDRTRIGTSSLRRRCQLRFINPAFTIVETRGNLQTRISQCQQGDCDCLILAMAGLKRLGINAVSIHPIEIEQMLPAPAQGVIAVERRKDDNFMAAMLESVNDAVTFDCTRAERTVLARLGANCDVPVAAYARREGNELVLIAQMFDANERQVGVVSLNGHWGDPVGLGVKVSEQLLALRGLH